MFFREAKARRWTKRQIKKNLNVNIPINCEQYIHSADKTALSALNKIPLLDTVCNKILSVMNDRQVNIINMSSMIHITEQQLPKIYIMVKSICKKIGIEMPELYLCLDRSPNAYAYGTEKHTLVIHSGLLECFEDDEIYAVLAHECGHIACNHMLYHTVARLVLGGGKIGLHELSTLFSGKGFVGNIVGGAISAVDSALELALYHWYRCSELSADRVAMICCENASPVIETMMRLAGGTIHIDSEINKELFISQTEDYKQIIDESKVNKVLEFLLTKDNEHPFLAIRAYEAQQFAASKDFERILSGKESD